MAKVFLGNEFMTVDQKGRVGIPARFAGVLQDLCPEQNEVVGLMITPERSIKIMPAPYFYEEIERWNQLNEHVDEQRMVLNMNTSLAETVTLDSQNRIKLNPLMMDLCSIRRKGQVAVVGSLKYMQIFDAQSWRRMLEQALPKLGAADSRVQKQQIGAEQPATIHQYGINTPGMPVPGEQNKELYEDSPEKRP